MLSPFTIPLFARVMHAQRETQHDRWVGMVVLRQLTERFGGSTIEYGVRWISPEGDPSNGFTLHAQAELTMIEAPKS